MRINVGNWYDWTHKSFNRILHKCIVSDTYLIIVPWIVRLMRGSVTEIGRCIFVGSNNLPNSGIVVLKMSHMTMSSTSGQYPVILFATPSKPILASHILTRKIKSDILFFLCIQDLCGKITIPLSGVQWSKKQSSWGVSSLKQHSSTTSIILEKSMLVHFLCFFLIGHVLLSMRSTESPLCFLLSGTPFNTGSTKEYCESRRKSPDDANPKSDWIDYNTTKIMSVDGISSLSGDLSRERR